MIGTMDPVSFVPYNKDAGIKTCNSTSGEVYPVVGGLQENLPQDIWVEVPVGSSRRGKRRYDAIVAPPTVALAPKRSNGKRGAHLRDRVDMQQDARDGAKFWASRVQVVRATWNTYPAEFKLYFQEQMKAAKGHIKSKLECLLLTMQMAAYYGIILPTPPTDETGSGLMGWVGFEVAADRAEEWRSAVVNLFPEGFTEESVRAMFRQANIVPAGWRWEEAWRGEVAFVLKQTAPP
jgi:hypothetical protein